MPHFIESDTEGAQIFHVVESSAEFCFGRRGDHRTDDGTMYVDGAVER